MWPTPWLKTHCLHGALEPLWNDNFILVSLEGNLTCVHQNHTAIWTKMLELRQTGRSLHNCTTVSSPNVPSESKGRQAKIFYVGVLPL